MKLNNNKRKKTIIIIVVAAIVVLAVVAGIIAIVVSNNRAQQQEQENRNIIRGISISSNPTKTVYYLGDAFDPTGTRIQVLTNSREYTYFVEWNELTFEGFDSSVTNDKLTITVTYMEYSTTFDIQVKEPETLAPTLESIEVYNFQTTYPLSEWNIYGPNPAGAKIRCVYSDGSVVEDIALKSKYISGYSKLDTAGATQITITYTDGVTTVSTTVEITITITN